MIRFLPVPALLLAFAATPCQAGCHVDQYNYYHGSEVPASMHATSGEPCSINFTNGRKSTIDSIAITAPAKHGAASWNGSFGYPKVVYKSSPGYRGQDEFVFDISGASARSDKPATVRVTVDVK